MCDGAFLMRQHLQCLSTLKPTLIRAILQKQIRDVQYPIQSQTPSAGNQKSGFKVLIGVIFRDLTLLNTTGVILTENCKMHHFPQLT